MVSQRGRSLKKSTPSPHPPANSRPPMAAAAPMHRAEPVRPITAMKASLCMMGLLDGFVGGIEQAEMQPRIADQELGDHVHQQQQQRPAADGAADQAQPD